MKYCKLVVLCLFCALFSSASYADLVKNKKEITFGNEQFAIVLDAKSGAWKKTIVDNKVVMSSNRTKIPFDLTLSKDGKLLSQSAVKYTLIDSKELSENSLQLTIDVDKFRCDIFYQIFPEKKTIKGSYKLANTTNDTVIVYNFSMKLPRVRFYEQSHYSCPGMFPAIKEKSLKDFVDGKVIHAWRDPNIILMELNPDLTIVSAIDRTKFYGDISRTLITETPTGINLSHIFESSGYLKNGDDWLIGDFYCMVQKNDSDTALKKMHNWMAELNITVPSNRHKDCLNPIIYSFHPGQPGHPFQDWGGFVPSTAQLPRIRNLNINTVWILPIESECPYIPDDFYRMANGIGTPEEYKQLVDTAHALGMNVWQDVVPHGGRNRCQRAKDHPDWLLRSENQVVPANRAFDYNNPDWQKYLGEVIKFYTETYSLDGWRIDTSGFSAQVNWSKNLPYQRGSWSMGQGGLNIMQIIRDTALASNNNAMTLAECDGSLYGTKADIVYDFPLCRQVFKSMKELSPADFVRGLQTYLYEQQYAELKDLVRLRYIESHDEPKAELLYGPDALRAGIAVTAWIYGVPMIYKEVEDGHSEVISKILKIRTLAGELQQGKADYQVIKATDGVFSCLRYDGKNFSIPLVNFNPQKTVAEIEIPLTAIRNMKADKLYDLWNQKSVEFEQKNNALHLKIVLPPYGFTVLANRLIQIEEPQKVIGGKMLPYSAFILDNNGLKPISLTDIANISQQLGENQALVIRINDTSKDLFYQVNSAYGEVKDKFRTRHPFYNSMCNNMYSLPSGHNVLWSSVQQPFGFDAQSSRISFYSENGIINFTFAESNRPAGVFLLDRIGQDHAPFLVIANAIPDSPIKVDNNTIDFQVSSRKELLDSIETASGDKRLFRIAGGWIFDNGKIRLRISSNGNLVEAWKKENGTEISILKDFKLEMRGGYIGDNQYFTSTYELETYMLFDRQADGTVKLQFFGRPRGHHYYQILAPNVFNYFAVYTLGDSDKFDLSYMVLPNVAPFKPNMKLSFVGTVLDKANFFTSGVGEKSFSNDNFSYFYPDLSSKVGTYEEFNLSYGDDKFIKIADTLEKRNTTDINGLYDGSFEFEYFGEFVDTVQSYCYAAPWFMPFGAEICNSHASDGEKAVCLTMNGKDEMLLKQSGVAKNMKKGETWRISVQASADNLKSYRMHLKLNIPNMPQISIPISNGSYGYQTFEAEFIAPADKPTFNITLGGKGPSGKIYFDNVKLERVK